MRAAIAAATARNVKPIFCLLVFDCKKSAYQLGNFIGLFVEREMSGIQNVNLGLWKIAPICVRFRRQERRIVTAPHNKRSRLRLLQPRLPARIGRYIGSIVVEEIALNFTLSGP